MVIKYISNSPKTSSPPEGRRWSGATYSSPAAWTSSTIRWRISSSALGARGARNPSSESFKLEQYNRVVGCLCPRNCHFCLWKITIKSVRFFKYFFQSVLLNLLLCSNSYTLTSSNAIVYTSFLVNFGILGNLNSFTLYVLWRLDS